MIWTQNIVRAALAGALALAIGTATMPAEGQATRITIEQAARIALSYVPGVVESIERDYERGVIVWEVEVRDTHGIEHEVIVDANTGRVIRIEVDD